MNDFEGYEDLLPEGYEDVLSRPVKEHSENILQRVAKATTQAVSDQPPSGMDLPFGQGMQLGMDFKKHMFPEAMANPVTDYVTDPRSYINAIFFGGAADSARRGAIRTLKNPSGVFEEKIRGLQSKNPQGRVKFLDIISRADSDPMVKKVLDKSGVIGKFGGRTMGEGGAVTENLDNLSLKHSQDLVNDIKVGLRKAVKEGDVRSNERGVSKMLGDLSGAQDEQFPEYAGARKVYGVSKNVPKFFRKHGGKIANAAERVAILGGLYDVMRHRK